MQVLPTVIGSPEGCTSSLGPSESTVATVVNASSLPQALDPSTSGAPGLTPPFTQAWGVCVHGLPRTSLKSWCPDDLNEMGQAEAPAL